MDLLIDARAESFQPEIAEGEILDPRFPENGYLNLVGIRIEKNGFDSAGTGFAF